MERNLNLLQVVGFKNSGKTTLIELLLSVCQKAGLRAGVIKHHGHGHLDVHDQEKDTGRFRESGAVVTGISAGNALELELVKDSDWEAEQIVALYQHLSVDVILVEGFKWVSYPKIVIVKQVEDFEAFQELENIMAVITWDERLKVPNGIPLFHRSEKEQYLSWAMSQMGVELGE